jgi:hypothetical protein
MCSRLELLDFQDVRAASAMDMRCPQCLEAVKMAKMKAK